MILGTFQGLWAHAYHIFLTPVSSEQLSCAQQAVTLDFSKQVAIVRNVLQEARVWGAQMLLFHVLQELPIQMSGPLIQIPLVW